MVRWAGKNLDDQWTVEYRPIFGLKSTSGTQRPNWAPAHLDHWEEFYTFMTGPGCGAVEIQRSLNGQWRLSMVSLWGAFSRVSDLDEEDCTSSTVHRVLYTEFSVEATSECGSREYISEQQKGTERNRETQGVNNQNQRLEHWWAAFLDLISSEPLGLFKTTKKSWTDKIHAKRGGAHWLPAAASRTGGDEQNGDLWELMKRLVDGDLWKTHGEL